MEEDFFNEPNIGLISSSKSKFRDLGRDFWLGETPGKSNPSLTLGLKNPKILKLIRFGTFAISWDFRCLRGQNFHRLNKKS